MMTGDREDPNGRRPGWGRRLAGLAMLVCAAGFTFSTDAPPAANGAALVFDGVTVVDVESGKLVPDQRVVVVGTRITAVGAAKTVKLPKGAQVVDAHGKYLIPGLWDMHIHPKDKADIFYPLLLANGVTGIRDAWSDVPLPIRLQWRREILAGTRIGPPRQILSSPALDERSPCTRGLSDGHTCVGDEADARRLVDSLKAAGYDMLKMYELSRPMYFTIAAEARRIGIPFGGHTEGVAAVDAADSGALTIDHMQHATKEGGIRTLCVDRTTASVEGCRAVAERFRQRGTWWVPTMTIYGAWTGMLANTKGQAIVAYLERRSSQFWWVDTAFTGNWLHDGIPKASDPSAISDSLGYLQIAQRAGMPILTGTDTGNDSRGTLLPGFSLHAELAICVAEGYSPLEALQAATLNPAKMWHATDSLGTVAAGKLADLVLLDADPLADITNTTAIRAVVANGRYFDRAALDSISTGIQAKGP